MKEIEMDKYIEFREKKKKEKVVFKPTRTSEVALFLIFFTLIF